MATDDARLKAGLNAWRLETNHNRMVDFQARAGGDPATEGAVKLAHFASSAFRVTTPAGLTIMIDPWRNHPAGKWDWYFHDFPATAGILLVIVGFFGLAGLDHGNEVIERESILGCDAVVGIGGIPESRGGNPR